MKKLNDLTEQEILALKDDQIEDLIKYAKASAGVKLVEHPKRPELIKIPEKDATVFMAAIFGQYLVFRDVTELDAVLDLIRKSTSKCSVNTAYISRDDKDAHIKPELQNAGYSSNSWDAIESAKVYSSELYVNVKEAIASNKKVKEQYDKDVKEFEQESESGKEIENEIWSKVQEVRDKYYKLSLHVQRFIKDYLPLAEGNEKVAMKFLVKAYQLSEEEQAYVLSNYQVPEQVKN